ncbi:MAG: hypothetical protein CMM87_03580 [Rickettsiales bacterium]|nr:hypothetical protein [Rickettsiales bacterium]|tara:strand:- start:6830 stop:8317 length:1488 start_codon:yes stop_codon:yes gene_type:complete
MKVLLTTLLFLLAFTTNATSYKSGWYQQEPYQYVQEGRDGILNLTGLDPELLRAALSMLYSGVSFEPLEWHTHKAKLQTGEVDLAAGVTQTPDLTPYVFYSTPYRRERTGLFTKKKPFTFFKKTLSPAKLIDRLTNNQYRLGVVRGFSYADPELNTFINNPQNQNKIYFARNNQENIRKLMNNEIDGFLADRLSGATEVLRSGFIKNIQERPIGKEAPVHICLSKSGHTEEQINQINQSLATLKKNGQLDSLFAKYVQPLMMMQILNSHWFFIIEIIGTIAFALSGVILAYRDRTTLFGAFIYALLPSAGGGILRDLLLSRHEIAFIQSPIYLFLALGTTLLSYACIKLFGAYKVFQNKKITKLFDHIYFTCDAFGYGSFTVLGVVVTVVMHAEPLWIWGPFIACLTSTGGGILRDMIRKQSLIVSLHERPYPEITIFWGFLLSNYLRIDTHQIRIEKVELAMIYTLIGTVLMFFFWRYFNFKTLFIHPPASKNK